MTKKKIRIDKEPHSSKKPRIDPSLKSSIDDNPAWQISTLDIGGPWGWQDIDKSVIFPYNP